MHMLYHRQPKKMIQALAGHKDPRSMEVYTRVFALELAATIAVPFTGDGRDAADILHSLPLTNRPVRTKKPYHPHRILTVVCPGTCRSEY